MSKISLALLCLTLLLSTDSISFAQSQPYTLDALRFSSQSFGGTARVQGLAGAQTALGGDISNLAGNPAGLGFFNKSVFSASPALNFISAESQFLGNSVKENKTNFNFNNIGVILAHVKDDVEEGTFRGGSFGIGLTRLNNFQREVTYSGVNSQNTIIDNFIEEINTSGTTIQELEGFADNGQLLTPSELAYGAFLIDYFPNGDGTFSFNTVVPLDPTRQQEKISTSGAQYQFDLGYGGNVSDKFYFGAGIGIQSIRYNRKRVYTETVLGPPDVLNGLTLTDELDIQGNGINLNVGLLYRVNDYVRVGASYRSPTWYSLDETFTSRLDARFNNFTYYLPSGDSVILTDEDAVALPTDGFNYKFQNPARINGGISVFAGKNGFISADVEFVNYGGASYNFSNDGGLEQQVNNELGSLLTNSVNIRVGGEYRAGILRFRAGYARYGSPYSNDPDYDAATEYLTLGTGVRLPTFYTDLGIVRGIGRQAFSPYSLSNGLAPVAEVENRNTNVVITVGTYF